MPVYWEQGGGGFQEEDFNVEVEDEDCVTQKPQMKGQWWRRTDGRSWGQNNIDFGTSYERQIVGW
jgi:hypothetical protein